MARVRYEEYQMLVSTKDLERHDVLTRDGEVGRMLSLFFDERTMEVEYLLVDTEKWLPGKKVVISPEVLIRPVKETSKIMLDMSMEELESSPTIEDKKPLSKERNESIFGGVPPQTFFLPTGIEPSLTLTQGIGQFDKLRGKGGEERTFLRSTRQIEGYTAHALDGRLGNLDEFIVDTHDWMIRYLVVDTRKILPGKRVILSPDWVKSYDWESKEVMIDHDKEQIRNSPEYDPKRTLDRDYEKLLYDHYGRSYYWK